MKVVVLGTGMIGTTIVQELAKDSQFNQVLAVDGSEASLGNCLKNIENPKVIGEVANLGEYQTVLEILSDADLAVACLPHSLSLQTVKAAIEAKCHLVDLVGSQYEEKSALHDKAKSVGVTIVPGCGVAPGIVSFLAARGVELLDEADEVTMICGGLPKNPIPPLWYQVVFRLESVLGLYTRNAIAAEEGEIVQLPPFSKIEALNFPEPVGECEAIASDAHSVAHILKDKVKRIYEKTVRYKGHFDKMKVLYELGFLDDKEVEVNGNLVNPKQLAMKLLEPNLKGMTKEDITVLRVVTKGKRNHQNVELVWEMVDFYDNDRDITSMAKTTAFPAVIMAQWIASGKIQESGVQTPEELIIGDRFDPFIHDLDEKGINISYSQEVF